jgi:hypothetical protein
MSTDTIEGSGFPLAFKVSGYRWVAGVVSGHTPARDVHRVEQRTMGGTEEVLVTEGAVGTTCA